MAKAYRFDTPDQLTLPLSTGAGTVSARIAFDSAATTLMLVALIRSGVWKLTSPLGFILLAALLTWNLMEHVMREHLRRSASTISGWDRKPAKTPTTFMMTTKFKGLLVARIAEQWHFTAPLSGELLQYVRALGLSEAALLRRGSAAVQRDAG